MSDRQPVVGGYTGDAYIYLPSDQTDAMRLKLAAAGMNGKIGDRRYLVSGTGSDSDVMDIIRLPGRTYLEVQNLISNYVSKVA